MKILIVISLGIGQPFRELVIEVPDDTTDEIIDNLAREEMYDNIAWTWEKIPDI